MPRSPRHNPSPRPGRSNGKAKPSQALPAAPDPSVANLESVGQKLKVYSLQHLLHNKRDFQVREPAKLSDVLQPWFDRHVRKPADKLEVIQELWAQLVPPQILDRARLAGLARGTLTVSLSSAPARSELDALLRRGLLQKLQEGSHGAVYRVKTLVDARVGRVV